MHDLYQLPDAPVYIMQLDRKKAMEHLTYLLDALENNRDMGNSGIFIDALSYADYLAWQATGELPPNF